MPLIGGLVLAIQLCFAYHALKTGRAYWWLFVIMGFPVMGCVLYYFVEVFPTSRESRSAEKAVRAIAKAFDPDKDLRAAVADVEACGSVENRVRLARECMEHGMHQDAAALYRSCLTGVHETDPDIRHGLAGALLQGGKFDEALDVAQKLRASHPAFRAPEVGLVIARALEGTNRPEEALAELRLLADAYPGEEGRWRYGALLRRLGRADDAQEVFRRMLRNAERQPTHYREAQRGWLDLARENMQA
ncbi:MAG TPA: tetratricopeptide repeat protein [Burkholderiales bacterium]|nr:tetratricopeptide repeat protein [Burkholderiales bacterium]